MINTKINKLLDNIIENSFEYEVDSKNNVCYFYCFNKEEISLLKELKKQIKTSRKKKKAKITNIKDIYNLEDIPS